MPKRPTHPRSERLTIRIAPQDLAIIEECKEYHGSGCNSTSDIIEQAVKYYLIGLKQREVDRSQYM